MNFSVIVTGLFLILVSLSCYPNTKCHGKTYHIKPVSMDRCPVEKCVTLSKIQKWHLNANSTLQFLPGEHVLDSDFSCGSLTYLKMISYHSYHELNIIVCRNFSRFNLYDILHVHVNGLHFQGCGGNKISAVKQLQILNSKFTHSNCGVALELKGTNAQIQNVYFQFNSALDCRSSDIQCCRVGGAMKILNSRNTTVKVISNIFIGNQALSGGAILVMEEATL